MGKRTLGNISKKEWKSIVKDSRFFNRTDPLHSKLLLKNRVDELAKNGKIAIVYGFMDCDCAVSDDNVDIVDANLMTLKKWELDFADSAEGRQWMSIEPMEYALSLKSSSRDLAMEAFEDGHPHHITY